MKTLREISVVGALFMMAAPLMAAPSAADLLRGMAGAEDTLNYSGTLLVTRRKAAPMSLKVQHSGPRQRLEWTAPPVMSGDLLINDGQSVWRYHRAENSAVQTRGAAEVDWGLLAQNMSVTSGGVGTVAGRSAWVVALTPHGGKTPTFKVWVDQANLARLRVEHLDEKGQNLETVALQSVQFAPVSAASFKWTPPAGARLTRTNGTLYADAAQAKRAADWVQYPSDLPANYNFESAIIDNGGKAGQAWLRYSNGVSRFSIFQQRTDDHSTVPPQATQGTWFMQQDGTRFVVLGLSAADAKLVLNSVR